MRNILLLLFPVFSLLAQTSVVDYQLRPLYHFQRVPEKSRIGFASWGALSDATTANPLKRWAVAGVVFKSKTRFVEVMGGAGHFYRDASISPVFDIRIQDNSVPRVKLWLEVFYPTRRTLYSPSITTPLTLRAFRRRITLWGGAEADLWWGANPTRGGGPKLVVPLGRHFALTTAYHFETQVLRNYALWSF